MEQKLKKIIDNLDSIYLADLKAQLCEVLEEIKQYKIMHNKSKGAEVIYGGKEFSSVSALARHLNVPNTTIYEWIWNGKTRDCIEVRFKDPNRTIKENDRYHRKRPSIQLEGVVYKSIAEAVKATGYSKNYVVSRCVKL